MRVADASVCNATVASLILIMIVSCVTQPCTHVLLLSARLHACLYQTSDDVTYDRHELALNLLPVMALHCQSWHLNAPGVMWNANQKLVPACGRQHVQICRSDVARWAGIASMATNPWKNPGPYSNISLTSSIPHREIQPHPLSASSSRSCFASSTGSQSSDLIK